jgi:hypothetical protein
MRAGFALDLSDFIVKTQKFGLIYRPLCAIPAESMVRFMPRLPAQRTIRLAPGALVYAIHFEASQGFFDQSRASQLF